MMALRVVYQREKAISAPVAEVAPKPAEIDKLKSLHDLYHEDFPNYMKLFATFNQRTQEPNFGIDGTLYYDFRARAKFLSFYFPAVPHQYEWIRGTSDNIPAMIESLEKTTASVKEPGDTVATSSKDIPFSNRIYIYYEGDFEPRQVANLLDVYKKHGYALMLRGNDYQTLRLLGGK